MAVCGEGGGDDSSIDPAADLTVPTAAVPTGTARDDSIIRLERKAGRHFYAVDERRPSIAQTSPQKISSISTRHLHGLWAHSWGMVSSRDEEV